MYLHVLLVLLMIIHVTSLAVANGNHTDDVEHELIAQNCWFDVMLKFRSIAQRPLGTY